MLNFKTKNDKRKKCDFNRRINLLFQNWRKLVCCLLNEFIFIFQIFREYIMFALWLKTLTFVKKCLSFLMFQWVLDEIYFNFEDNCYVQLENFANDLSFYKFINMFFFFVCLKKQQHHTYNYFIIKNIALYIKRMDTVENMSDR